MKSYKKTDASFSDEVKIYESTDRAHADVLNVPIKTLYENTMALNNSLKQKVSLNYNAVSDTLLVFHGQKLLPSGETYTFPWSAYGSPNYSRMAYLCIVWAFYDSDQDMMVNMSYPQFIPINNDHDWGLFLLHSYYNEGHVYSPFELIMGSLMYDVTTTGVTLTFNENCGGTMAIGNGESGVTSSLQLFVGDIYIVYR